jgi:hypothetical protein
MIALPSYVDIEIWSAFVETRKAMKVPFTQAAQKLVVRKLMKMHGEGWDVNASLEKSAIYGYRGVFEVAKVVIEKKVESQAPESRNIAPMPDYIRKQLSDLTRRMTV